MLPHCNTCSCGPEIEQPEGCVCDVKTWMPRASRLPPICGAHVGNRIANCGQCEHDYECHKEGWKE